MSFLYCSSNMSTIFIHYHTCTKIHMRHWYIYSERTNTMFFHYWHFNIIFIVIDVDPFNPATWKDFCFEKNTDVFSFYLQFGLKRGFSVRINYQKPRKAFDKKLPYYLCFSCNREGSKKVKDSTVKPRATKRIECKAKLTAHFEPTNSHISSLLFNVIHSPL